MTKSMKNGPAKLPSMQRAKLSFFSSSNYVTTSAAFDMLAADEFQIKLQALLFCSELYVFNLHRLTITHQVCLYGHVIVSDIFRKTFVIKRHIHRAPSAVSRESDRRSRGDQFDPSPVPYF